MITIKPTMTEKDLRSHPWLVTVPSWGFQAICHISHRVACSTDKWVRAALQAGLRKKDVPLTERPGSGDTRLYFYQTVRHLVRWHTGQGYWGMTRIACRPILEEEKWVSWMGFCGIASSKKVTRWNLIAFKETLTLPFSTWVFSPGSPPTYTL